MITIWWIYALSHEVCLNDMQEVVDEKSLGAFDKYLALTENLSERTRVCLYWV